VGPWHRTTLFVALTAAFAATTHRLAVRRDQAAVTAVAVAQTALGDALPSNRWVEVSTVTAGLPVYRTDHGGAAYDPTRNSVFLFGSDTHARHFDNRIQELRLDDMTWHRPYERSPRYTLRTDARGVRVAGGRALYPWPMHVYDSMVYDPTLRALVVTSAPKHNFVPAPGAQLDGTWIYSATENRWSILGETTPETPNFFASASVYDPGRDTIIGYAALAESAPFVPPAGEANVPRTGIWEIGPDRQRWQLVSSERHHWGWFNAEFDVANRAMIVFGGDPLDPSIWLYRVGAVAGEPGSWERRRPGGDQCPGGFYFPAAYDGQRAVTLFMPYDAGLSRTITCVYDAARNVVRRLPSADLPNVGLNYTMVYVANEDYFLLLTGSFSAGEVTRVWTLKLDLTLLAPPR
jgi:hypothetical protein